MKTKIANKKTGKERSSEIYEIKDVQKMQLEMLLEFDRICKKNNIKYQLCGGTLLGSVRHKGFIPWDDDIDVCLLRADYDRFIEACKTDLDCKYFLQTCETDKDYIFQFAKMRKNYTLFWENIVSECKIHHGIFIDIFPLDNIFLNTFSGNLQLKLFFMVGRINLTRIKALCYRTSGGLGLSSVQRFMRLSCHYLFRIIPKRWIDILQNKILRMFQDKKSDYCFPFPKRMSDKPCREYIIKKKDFYNTINGEFEGYVFPIPKNYSSTLSRVFGNYSKLPAIKDRRPCHNIKKIMVIELAPYRSWLRNLCMPQAGGQKVDFPKSGD